MQQLIQSIIDESIELKQHFFSINAESIITVSEILAQALKNKNKILLFGNGGSAADCQHIAAEFVGRFKLDRNSLAAIALTTDTSVLTAIGNDYGFVNIFSRQIEGLGHRGDIAIAISTSGNSDNVLNGVKKAKELGLITIGFTGSTGGLLGLLVDYHFNVPHRASARVQEIHIMLGHILCELVETCLITKSVPSKIVI
jgi:D-sedoheptulose 7-phosphate isomerase